MHWVETHTGAWVGHDGTSPAIINYNTRKTTIPAIPRETELNWQRWFAHHITIFTKRCVGLLSDDSQERSMNVLPMWGKTINLMELQIAAIDNGFKVPWGYGIWYDAYKEYANTWTLPDQIIDLIVHLQHELGGNIAIRSSGNVEDGSKASAAWVFESYYIKWSRVKTDEGWIDMWSETAAVEFVVRAIYDTTRSEGAITYFQNIDVSPDDINMWLTIQKLVDKPAAAGVILTEHLPNGENRTYVNYVHDSFGNVIADGTTPWNSVYYRGEKTVNHTINAESGRPHETMRSISAFIVELMAQDLGKTLAMSFAEHGAERKTGDIEFAIASKRFGQFLMFYEADHKKLIEQAIIELTEKTNFTPKEAEGFLNCLSEAVKIYRQMYGSHKALQAIDTSDRLHPLYEKELKLNYIALIRKASVLAEYIKDNGVLTHAIRELPDHDTTRNILSRMARWFVDVLQYRDLVRSIPVYNLNARWSLASIYNPENPEEQRVEGVIVNIEECTDVEELELIIAGYIEQGKKVILVGDAPGIQHEHALEMSSSTLLQSSGSWSHIALRAGEWKKPAIGWCKIGMFTTGMEVTLDTDQMMVLDTSGIDLLEPLYMWENINEEYINAHIHKVNDYIYHEEPSAEEAISQLISTVRAQVSDPEMAYALEDILNTNAHMVKQADASVYTEEGFDSCQTKRFASKILAEVMLLWWYIYEQTLLGNTVTLSDAQQRFKSQVIIDDKYADLLPLMAKALGANQEFLYPGVSPSSADTPTLQRYIQAVLDWNPMPSVRAMTGVWWLRNDMEENHTVNFQQFLSLKMSWDKRYYPGVVTLNALVDGYESISFMNTLATTNPHAYREIVELVTLIREQSPESIDDAALLCSAYLPDTKSIPTAVFENAEPKTSDHLSVRLLQTYHSPRSELHWLQMVIEKLVAGETVEDAVVSERISELAMHVRRLKTFNSTMHIPRADGLASMANGLLGKLTNKEWHTAIRYGLGFDQKSFEVVQYDLADGRTAYIARRYDNKLFQWIPVEEFIVGADHPMRKEIEDAGFLKTAKAQLSA